jgi:peptidoglycan/xylan/chitin deacetylase (PgdA/CDA1 family)
MKAVMYHYVREFVKELPHLIYLHIEDFTKQIDYFMEHYHILSIEEMKWCTQNEKIIDNGIILTFDDGLIDHYNFVFPALKERNLWGIFYISTKPYKDKCLLDVHRIHYLLGRYGGQYVYECIQKLLQDGDYINGNESIFSSKTYLNQDNDIYVVKTKQILNYYLAPYAKSRILDELMANLCEDECALSKNFYLQEWHIKDMIDCGMSIGSHGHTHTLFGNLTHKEQYSEINESFSVIKYLTDNKNINSFCYPYGGKLSYTKYTIQCLQDAGVDFAFSVESRNINKTDIRTKYELPRFDCNEFKYGEARKEGQNE